MTIDLGENWKSGWSRKPTDWVNMRRPRIFCLRIQSCDVDQAKAKSGPQTIVEHLYLLKLDLVD